MTRLLVAAELRLHRLRMRRYYRQCFSTDAGKIVLADLAQFCGSDQDLFDLDPRREAYRLGMRRVLLRISKWMNMTIEEVEALARREGQQDQED
jgi:hypothetical protein